MAVSKLIGLGNSIAAGASRQNVNTTIKTLLRVEFANAYGYNPEVCRASKTLIAHLRAALKQPRKRKPRKETTPKPTGKRFASVHALLKNCGSTMRVPSKPKK